MLRGEFRRADGLVIPNNVTTAGTLAILNLAFRGTNDTLWIGLCEAVYEPDLLIQDVDEPTLATNGYVRKELQANLTDWPTAGELNGETYIESKDLIWVASGGAFDHAISRMFASFEESALVGDVFALSAALPESITIDEDTPPENRTFRYRLYLR